MEQYCSPSVLGRPLSSSDSCGAKSAVLLMACSTNSSTSAALLKVDFKLDTLSCLADCFYHSGTTGVSFTRAEEVALW